MRIATLTDGTNTWLVIDYDAVKEYSTANTTSFQIWIGVNGVEDISYAYGPVTGNGDGGLLTAGVENKFGNSGQNSYYNGAGTLPAEGDQLVVTSVPGQAGAATPVTYQARAVFAGAWKNCVELTSSLFQGTSVTCFSGTVTADPVRGVSKTAPRGIDLPAPHRNR